MRIYLDTECHPEAGVEEAADIHCRYQVRPRPVNYECFFIYLFVLIY